MIGVRTPPMAPHGAAPNVDRGYLAYLNALEASYCARCNLGKGVLECSRAPGDPTRMLQCPIAWTTAPAAPARPGRGLPAATPGATIMSALASHLGP